MKEYKYRLEKGSRKHLCPQCNKKKYHRYVDTESGEYLPYEYGRCDREDSCKYHHTPYKEMQHPTQMADYSPVPLRPQSYFDFDTFLKTMKDYDKNVFIKNLYENVSYPFKIEDIEKVIKMYQLGTISKGQFEGAITFPFIDVNKNVCAIQCKTFDKKNHTILTTFLNVIIKKHYEEHEKPFPEWLSEYEKNDLKVSCLFGEHLLSTYKSNPICLVEAPKSAVIGQLYSDFPTCHTDPIWLAVYNQSTFTYSRLKRLSGRKVIVFPDLSKDSSTFEKWKNRAIDFQKYDSNLKLHFSTLLEEIATEEEKQKGLDIADFLIKHDWRKTRSFGIEQTLKI